MIFTIRDSCLVPSPCNAHNHMITLAHVQIALLFEIYKSSKYDGQQQYVQSLSNNEKSRSFVFWILLCVPQSSRRKSTDAMLAYCNSRVLVHKYHTVPATCRWSWWIRQCYAVIAPFRYDHSFCYELYSSVVPRVHEMHRHIFNGPTSKYSSRRHLDCCLQSYALQNDRFWGFWLDCSRMGWISTIASTHKTTKNDICVNISAHKNRFPSRHTSKTRAARVLSIGYQTTAERSLLFPPWSFECPLFWLPSKSKHGIPRLMMRRSGLKKRRYAAPKSMSSFCFF